LPTSARTDQKVKRVRSGRDSEGRRESGKKARDAGNGKMEIKKGEIICFTQSMSPPFPI
jgi:hypothetical protein